MKPAPRDTRRDGRVAGARARKQKIQIRAINMYAKKELRRPNLCNADSRNESLFKNASRSITPVCVTTKHIYMLAPDVGSDRSRNAGETKEGERGGGVRGISRPREYMAVPMPLLPMKNRRSAAPRRLELPREERRRAGRAICMLLPCLHICSIAKIRRRRGRRRRRRIANMP
jgi:hypothetical protein